MKDLVRRGLTNGTGQMISVQRFHILDLKGIQVQIVEAQECDRVLNEVRSGDAGNKGIHTHVDFETESVRFHKIGTLLYCANILRVFGGLPNDEYSYQ